MAKDFLEDFSIPYPDTQRFDQEGWSLSIAGVKQEHFDFPLFYDLTFGKVKSREYWMKRFNTSTLDEIDWDTVKRSTSTDQGINKWLTKHMAGFSATGRVMKRRKEWDHDRCPRCDTPNEDRVHVIKCKHPTTVSLWKKSLENLQEEMEILKTDPEIIKVIITRLNEWWWDRREMLLFVKPEIEDALRSQKKIGWEQMLYGRLSIKWRTAQESWLVRCHSKFKTSTTWAKRLAKLFIHVSWSLWEQRNDMLHNPDHPWKIQQLLQLQDRIDPLRVSLAGKQIAKEF